MARVTGTYGGGIKIGPAIILKVMAGDKFNVTVNSWYKTNGQTPGTPTGIVTALLNALNSNVGNLAGSKASAVELSAAGAFTPGANTFLTPYSHGDNAVVVRFLLC